jgi:osmotically-inducible protein OsmY
MCERATRWAIAGFVGLAMSSIDCAKGPTKVEERLERIPVVDDDSLVNALDTSLEMRVIDRLELDSLLSDRDIRIAVVDGVLSITGEVWTPVEKQRVGELVRSVAGTVDVTNDLAVRPPR